MKAQDLIHFLNGDRVAGTIKTLGQGQLVLDVPAMDGDVNIDWKRISRIESDRVFQFQRKDGTRFSGRIAKNVAPDAALDEVLIISPQGDQRLHQDDIVAATQTVGETAHLLQVNLGAGLSLAKSNNQKQVDIEGSLRYQTTNYRLTSSVNSIYGTQASAANTNRQDLSVSFARGISRNWLLGTLAGFQRSEEQQLDLRTVLGGGPSRRILDDNHVMLYATGGVVWNHERYKPESGREVVDQVEGLAALDFFYFKFKMWKLDTNFRLYPSITVSGRVRGDVNSSFRVRLVKGKGLWWNSSAGLNFDNKPPANGRATDYVTSTSVSYGFP
ncbi:MAG TPA: DUF481 domain-containing protein [Bryobacteraceae bacterium]|nr:DUF481 domain-containing protein [Bryobacteraceae bacterium]